MGKLRCLEKGSKKPILSAKPERMAKKPEGRISLKVSRPTLISMLPSELADSKQRVFFSEEVPSRSTSDNVLFFFSIRRSTLLARITRKRGLSLGEESRLDESSTFSRLIIASLREKISFSASVVKIASLR